MKVETSPTAFFTIIKPTRKPSRSFFCSQSDNGKLHLCSQQCAACIRNLSADGNHNTLVNTENIHIADNPQLHKTDVMPSCLRLSLKTKWFEMTKAGIKTEDYRDITPYWIKRLTQYQNYKGFDIEAILELLKNGQPVDFKHKHNWIPDFCFPKSFEHNVMTLGYPSNGDTERILTIEHKGIEIRTGLPEWGAEPDKLYFVILHGAIIE